MMRKCCYDSTRIRQYSIGEFSKSLLKHISASGYGDIVSCRYFKIAYGIIKSFLGNFWLFLKICFQATGAPMLPPHSTSPTINVFISFSPLSPVYRCLPDRGYDVLAVITRILAHVRGGNTVKFAYITHTYTHTAHANMYRKNSCRRHIA